MLNYRRIYLAIALLPLLAGAASYRTTYAASSAQEAVQYFPETQHLISGRFLQYWNEHGGLAQQGYPLSEQFQEMSNTDGKTYTVQYFERAVFEAHPENAAPNDVLLSLLGNFLYKQKYPNGAPGQTVNSEAGAQKFPETGHTVGGKFLTYWQQHGGLAQQGYPISDEFQEKSDLDGKTYTVQYFERAVFEAHPENQPPYDVLLSQLGKFQIDARYPNGSNPAAKKGVLIPDPPGKVMLPYFQFDTKDVLVLGGQTRGIAFHAAAGNKYALVFTIVYNLNSTDPPTHIDSDAVRMEDSAGRTFNLASDDVQRTAAFAQSGYPRMLYNFANIYSDDVPPAGHLYETLVFEVPSDSNGYNLILGQ